MATFSYIAKRSDGSETRGVINAATHDAAREELRKRGLMIEDIRESAPPPRPMQQQQPRPVQPPKAAQPPRPAQPTQQRPAQQQSKPSVPVVAPKPVAKAAPLPWSASSNAAPMKAKANANAYAPLHETLRIFAGWLLAWYGLIYALGFLEYSGKLPSIPFVHELFLSPLVLQFTFGTFLLLALSNIHRWLGGGVLKGFALAALYVALVAGFVVYG